MKKLLVIIFNGLADATKGRVIPLIARSETSNHSTYLTRICVPVESCWPFD